MEFVHCCPRIAHNHAKLEAQTAETDFIDFTGQPALLACLQLEYVKTTIGVIAMLSPMHRAMCFCRCIVHGSFWPIGLYLDPQFVEDPESW